MWDVKVIRGKKVHFDFYFVWENAEEDKNISLPSKLVSTICYLYSTLSGSISSVSDCWHLKNIKQDNSNTRLRGILWMSAENGSINRQLDLSLNRFDNVCDDDFILVIKVLRCLTSNDNLYYKKFIYQMGKPLTKENHLVLKTTAKCWYSER